jgi:hypothetical protein
MQTRRELLLTLSTLPAAAAVMPRSATRSLRELEIVTEPHCLSEESARGYRTLVSGFGLSEFGASGLGRGRETAIVLPASCRLCYGKAEALLGSVRRGCLLILESGIAYSSPEEARGQARILNDVFGIRTGEPIEVSGHEASYISYNFAEPFLIRTFGAIVPVRCTPKETIANFAGTAVAMRRLMGEGEVVYLGSILGVGLLAREREARQVGQALLRA